MKALPVSLLEQIKSVKGFRYEEFLAAHKDLPRTSVRINPFKKFTGFTNAECVPWCSEGKYLSERPVFTLDPAYHAGAYYVQEASSMFTGFLAGKFTEGKSNLRVLDLCASPGGKSTHLASVLGKDSLLISNDVIRSRATILEENITRWGYMNTWVTCNDPSSFGQLKSYFDVILIDAPCSGSGLFRKNEKAIDEWNESLVELCSERQKRIIADAWPSLKEDGILIYATCSYSIKENEDILDWMGQYMSVTGINIDVPAEWGIITVESLVKGLPCYRFFPDRVNGEGFFIAAIRKNEDSGNLKIQKNKIPGCIKLKTLPGDLWNLGLDETIIRNEANGSYLALNSAHTADHELLKSKLYFRKTGTSLGEAAHNDWIPDHESALSIHLPENVPNIDLNLAEALKYLKKEDVGIAPRPKGWYLARYEGLGLGWMKSLGNRYNNTLPKSLRIRMNIQDEDNGGVNDM